LHKENEPKESAANHLIIHYLCAAQNNRALRNSLRSDSPRAFPVISPLLGCVKWPYKKTLFFL
jgi:hypothetical protein